MRTDNSYAYWGDEIRVSSPHAHTLHKRDNRQMGYRMASGYQRRRTFFMIPAFLFENVM